MGSMKQQKYGDFTKKHGNFMAYMLDDGLTKLYSSGHSSQVRLPKIYPPSNFSYEMGRTWATVQIASQDFFVQTGEVVPPILYLE